MKENRKTIIFMTAVGFIMMIVTAVAMSFAYFTTVIEEGDIYSTTGRAVDDSYRITMTEVQSGVSLNNTYPMPDANGLELDPYTFTVKNEDTVKLTIDVYMEVLNTSTLVDELVNVGIDGRVKTLNSNTATPSEGRFRSSYKIYSFVLDPNESKTYDLRTWINANGTMENAQNKTWAGRILVRPRLFGNIVDKIIASSNGTKANFDDPATTDEGVFEIEDDYGISYYYRGAVTNNYVKFGQNASGQDMFWRIIRVNGDGSLRIMYTGTQAYANGTNNSDMFIKTDQQWNSVGSDAKYVGWMYGGAKGVASTTKAQAQTNTTSSDIKTAVDEWYKTNIVDTGFSTAISDTLFCNDRSTPGKNVTKYEDDTGLGYGQNYTVYGAYARTNSNEKLTFKCPQKNDAFTVDDTKIGNGDLTYPVGLITADEIMAAGSGKYGKFSSKFYLHRPNNWYWSFSPQQYTTSAYILTLINASLINSSSVDAENGGVAPVINLSAEYSSTLIGTGTATDPYRAA